MKIETTIARRYLFSKHKLSFITIISYLSIFGITIGVGALIVVLSVFNGFGDLVTAFLVQFDPHLRIEAVSESSFAKLNDVEKILKQENEIKHYSPFVSGKVLAIQGKFNQVITLKGIDAKKGEDVYGIKDNIIAGNYALDNDGITPKVILGILLADRLQSIIGDTITIISPVGIEKSLVNFSLPVTQKFVVSGIYSSNNNDYDAQYMFTPLSTAQRILGYGNNFQGFELRLDNISHSNSVKNKLLTKINPQEFSINTWYDFHKELYSMMLIERWVAYLILSLIIAVAVFNILVSLNMSVVEKKRDIGVLRTMGLNEKSIVKIFIYQGVFIGVIGTLVGFALGYFVYYLQITYNIYPLDPTQYKINSLPMALRVTDFIAVGTASIVLSFLAAIYPAKKAAKINPIEAIKWE
jgi:lipoprotein-releasing system permease protein